MKVLLGVPTLNRYDLLGKLLASAEAGTRRPDHYLIVDNGRQLDAKLADGTLVLPSTLSGYVVEHPETNLGVAASWNVILKHAEALNALAIISGDDVIVGTESIARLVEKAEQTHRLFICANGASAWSFFLQKPELAQKIGYYDDTFWPGYFEDNDYHYRMKLVGEDYDSCPEACVEHAVSSTLAAMDENQKRWLQKEYDKNSRYYGIKWGGPPEHERLTEPSVGADGHRGGREIP